MSRMVRRLLAVAGGVVMAVAVFVVAPGAEALSVSVGAVTFDTFVPGTPDNPGTNAFDVLNFTGASATPPDFPVLSELHFLDAHLTLAPGAVVRALGDIGPGSVSDPLGMLQFPATTDFASGLFTAMLSDTTFSLDGGGVFVASSPTISALLLPSSGEFLSPGDLVVIDVPGEIQAVPIPEPASVVTLAAGAVVVWSLARRGRYRRRA